MADNNKNQLAEAANSPLQDLTFENIIAGPLIACVDAQHEASMVAYDYLMSLGFRKDSKNLADFNQDDGNCLEQIAALLTDNLYA
jgi:hypothetical protein